MAAAKEIEKTLVEANKLYERQDFTRGMRVITNARKKHPDHGELMAVHALFLQNKKETEQALELSEKALRADMKNQKIWKICGSITKDQGDYLKAMQYYSQAFRMNNSDPQLLLDLANLQLYNRNYPQFLESSRQLLDHNSGSSYIVRYAVAKDLNGDPSSAEALLTSYESKFMPVPQEEENIFRSELCRYHGYLLLKLRRYADLLKYYENNIRPRDEMTTNEQKLEAYVGLGQNKEAVETIHLLLADYPENGDYFVQLEKILSPEDLIKELFKIKTLFRSSYAHVRLLELLPMDDQMFNVLLEEHLKKLLLKGSPAVYETLADMSNEKLLFSVEMARKLEVPINVVPIVHLFAAHIYTHIGEYHTAIKEIDTGIEHTSTVIELHVAKTTVLRKMGLLSEAVAAGEFLSNLDPADRSTNIVYAKTLLEAGMNKKAFASASSFSIDQKQKTRLMKSEFNTYHPMAAKAALFGEDIDGALKQLNLVVKHHDSFRKGQFNYLGWGMRRMMALVEMIEWADNVYKLPAMAKASTMLFQIYLANGSNDEALKLADKINSTSHNAALAYTCVVYALNNQALPAIRCAKKATGPYLFLIAPAMKKLLANNSSLNEIVRKVVESEYKLIESTPETVDELVASARGHLVVGNNEKAKELLLKVITSKVYKFNIAKVIVQIAKVELKDAAFASSVRSEINSRYPEYDLSADNYEKEDHEAEGK